LERLIDTAGHESEWIATHCYLFPQLLVSATLSTDRDYIGADPAFWGCRGGLLEVVRCTRITRFVASPVAMPAVPVTVLLVAWEPGCGTYRGVDGDGGGSHGPPEL